MKKTQLGKTDIYVTPLGMGVLTIGPTQLNTTVEKGAAIIRYALEQGINFLDTAEYYRTYPFIRRALDELAPSFASGAITRPVIVSKSLARSYSGMKSAIDDCLTSLGLEQIDIFLMHEVREHPDLKNRSAAWECLVESKEKGLVKAIGLSTHHTDAALDAVNTMEMDIFFPLLNFKSLGIRRGRTHGTKEEMELAIRAAKERDMGVLVMKVFGGGSLLKEYVNSLDYITGITDIDSVMIGMGSEKDIDEAVAYFDRRLPKGFAPDITEKNVFIVRGDCEGCGACVERCTSKAIRLDNEGIAVIDINNCVKCSYCMPVCPSRALIFL